MPDSPVHHVLCPSCGDAEPVVAAAAAAVVASMRDFFVRHGDCVADADLRRGEFPPARRTA